MSAFVSSADANETFETPMSFFTAWLTSSRVVASTTQAQYCFGLLLGRHDDGVGGLLEGMPYFSQYAAVSAKSGSISWTS